MVRTESPVRILKVMGLDRSGSTIVDLVLGNHPRIENVREVANVVVNGWISRNSTMWLRYEDFVADPRGALERIGTLIELDLTDVAEAAPSGQPMQAGHNVGGKKTKKSGIITLRPGAQEWSTALSYGAATFVGVDGMAHALVWL